MKFEIELTDDDIKKAVVSNELAEHIKQEFRRSYWNDREVKKLVKQAVKDRVAEVLSERDWWDADSIKKMAAESLERKVLATIKEELT